VVTFRYLPRSFAVGAGVSFVAWGAMLALGAIAALRRRLRHDGPASSYDPK
jgi:MYXO-CTERM domain-containing protein